MKRGFTLIELLLVVAIIGLLASVVLASLNSARKRDYAKDPNKSYCENYKDENVKVKS